MGVRLQDAGTPGNRQRVLLQVVGVPDGAPDQPDNFSARLCFQHSGAPGTIVGLDDKVRYEGPGAYTVSATISTGSDASANCAAGPTSTHSFTSAPTISARFVGRLYILEPTTVEGRENPPFGGIEVVPSFGAGVTEVLCARNPVRRPDGSLGGTTTRLSTARGSGRVRLEDETLFNRPGRWACVARGNGRAVGPWTPPTPTRAVVTGSYGFREGTRRLVDASGPRYRITAQLDSESAGGLLTVLARHNGGRPRRVARVRVGRGGRVDLRLNLPRDGHWLFLLAYGGNALVAARPAFPEFNLLVERSRGSFLTPCAPRRC